MRRQFTLGANVDREGHACCDLKFFQPNILGSSISSTATVSSTATAARDFALRFAAPVPAGSLHGASTAEVEVARKSRQEATAAGYSSIYTQCLFQLLGGLHLGMNWKLDAEWSLRDLNPTGAPGFYPSLQLQKEALQSMKTSLKYSMSRYAQMGDGVLHAKVAMEIAGPPGNVTFLRSEAAVKAGLPVLKWGRIWHGHLSMGCGVLLPAGRSCPQDRFHLGGASGSYGLKGFAERGAEPREKCYKVRTEELKDNKDANIEREHYDAQGGEAMASLFAAVSTPCEFLRVEGAQLLAFGTCGILQRSLQKRGEKLRMSVGGGIALPLGPGTLELTFAQPLRCSSTDVLQRWQLGLRLQFE